MGVNKGKVTFEMREKWKEQILFLNEIEYKIDEFKEIEFIHNINKTFLKKGIDLSFHQSTWLNAICCKYQ